jgi:hypothetical protein
VALYEIEMDRGAQNPEEWSGCRIMRKRTRELSADRYLVDISQNTVARVRGLPGIIAIGPAVDGEYVDDYGRTYVVQDGQVVDVL